MRNVKHAVVVLCMAGGCVTGLIAMTSLRDSTIHDIPTMGCCVMPTTSLVLLSLGLFGLLSKRK